MLERKLKMSDLAFLAVTRGMLGAGVGLLLADKLGADKRHTIGLSLVAVGAITTIPLALRLFGRGNKHSKHRDQQPTQPAFVEC